MKILMVLTSHDVLGSTGRKTGFWLEEFAAPYFVFRDARRTTDPRITKKRRNLSIACSTRYPKSKSDERNNS